VRVSFTVPRERESNLVALMHEYAEHIASTGTDHGAWLVVDRRPGTLAPHVYGLALVDQATKATLVSRWCAKTGADANAHRGRSVLVSVKGWAEYVARRGATALRTNLLRPGGPGCGVITYAGKPLPNGEARDLDGDQVAASGALAGPWRASRRAGEPSGHSAPRAHVPLMSAGVPRRLTCEVCGASLSGKRADAKACSTTCRMKKRDRRKPSRGRPTTGSRPTATISVNGVAHAARRSSADALLALVRALVGVHGRAPFTSTQARHAGRTLGIPVVEVDALLAELVEDGAAENMGGEAHVFTPPHRVA